ncbi:MAG: hypothetical protein CBC83_07705 [Flavobacteriales bacterium TMED123]|nr:MAG: hypothetical protein CBC83_07705 [Flavobacteriales bacterium TMED123]
MKKLLLLLCFPFFALSQQLINENIFYDGNNREYIIYIPQSYSPSISSPILFAFHGGDGYAIDFMNNEADFRSISDTASFILVYPQALEDPNDGGSTNWLHKDPTDHKDIFFIETLIDTIAYDYNVNMNRVYAIGYSLGGMFCYELACQLNSRITSVASVAGAAFLGAFSNCNLTHPTAVLTINGTIDGTHPYNGLPNVYFSIADINNFWMNNNNTDVTPIITQIPNINVSDSSTVERYSWQNGNGCVSIEELKIINGDHDWPSPLSFWANQDIDASVEVWNFVSKFDMMGLIGCNSTNHSNIDIVNSKSLIRIVDLLGRESKDFNSKSLFYIYDDGTVEKKIIIE